MRQGHCLVAEVQLSLIMLAVTDTAHLGGPHGAQLRGGDPEPPQVGHQSAHRQGLLSTP